MWQIAAEKRFVECIGKNIESAPGHQVRKVTYEPGRVGISESVGACEVSAVVVHRRTGRA